MNIVLFFAMWIQQCVGQVCIVCVPLEDQSYGVMILHTCKCMCVQWKNLWTKEPDACTCTEDQSYGNVHVHVGSYMYLRKVSSEGSMSSMKDHMHKE